MAKSMEIEMIEACSERGCPVCRLTGTAVERSLKSLFYENVNDPESRLELRKSLGFCKAHAWLLLEAEIGDPLGVAIIYNDLISNILRDWPEPGEEPARSGVSLFLRKTSRGLTEKAAAVKKAFTPSKPCPACLIQEETAARYIRVLLENIEKNEMAAAFKASNGLCVPHLIEAIQNGPHSSGLDLMLNLERQRFSALRTELSEIIRKNDHRFQHERFGSEADAWRRAIATFYGDRHNR